MRLGAKLAVLGVCLSAGASWCAAQSLGDVARQERARRANEAKHAPVITNEDLKRDRILPPAPAETAPTQAASPAPQPLPASVTPSPDVPLWQVADQPGFSLGEHARGLRELKKQRQQEENAQARLPKPHPDTAASALVRSVVKPAFADFRPLALPAASHVLGSKPAALSSTPAVSHRAAAPQPMKKAAAKKEATTPKVAPAAKRPARRPATQRIVLTQEPDPGTLVVEPGDSLWRIAEDLFGDGRLWKVLWQANPEIRNPNRIYVGQSLRIPAPVQVTEFKTKLQKKVAHAAATAPGNGATSHGSATAKPTLAPTASLEPAPAPAPRR